MKNWVCMDNLSHQVRSLPLTPDGDAVSTKLCSGSYQIRKWPPPIPYSPTPFRVLFGAGGFVCLLFVCCFAEIFALWVDYLLIRYGAIFLSHDISMQPFAFLSLTVVWFFCFFLCLVFWVSLVLLSKKATAQSGKPREKSHRGTGVLL